jgi:hypothetical protein
VKAAKRGVERSVATRADTAMMGASLIPHRGVARCLAAAVLFGAFSAVHVTAVAHEYYGADPGYLPPQLTDYTDRAGGVTGMILAVAWVLVLGGLVYRFRNRLFGTRVVTTPMPGDARR